MSALDDAIALRDNYLADRGLTIQDFPLGLQFPPIPPTNWDYYKTLKFPIQKLYRRWSFSLVYQRPDGDPWLLNDIPYTVCRFIGTPTGVPDGEDAPKMLSQWGRRSELHFEPLRDGRSWESLPDGTRILHCESLIKAKAVHKATGIPCIGYNGVNGYSSNKQGVELIHLFSEFDFSRMDNVILFDSDVHTNQRVIAARNGLAHKLRHIAVCSLVSFANLPQRNPNEEGVILNWGPDDFLMARGAEQLLKVIEAAVPYQDEEFSQLVEEMNDKVRWVRGQHAVFDREKRTLIPWQSAQLTFKNVNRVVASGNGKKKAVYGTDVWLASANREQVDNVGYRYLGEEFFDRAGELIANEYVPAGASPGPESLTVDSPIYQTLLRLFTDADLEQLRSYLKFLKYSEDKPTSYCVLWSNARGVGKGWFTEMARSLLGRRHVAEATADSLAEKFNLHTINTRLLIAHEFQASSGANKKLALQYLKTYVGDETIMVRAMNRNPYSAEVRAGLIITVNDKSDMPSDGLGDRRQWYIEGAAGARERNLELWKDEEWIPAWEALKNEDEMSRFARWVEEGADIDFKNWRPPLTEERMEDLIEGMSGPVQIAHEVRQDCLEMGINVLDGKMIRSLMIKKMEGQELYVVGKAFGKVLKDAGWWTDRKYERATESRSAAWFTGPSNEHVSVIPGLIRANSTKLGSKF